MKILVISNLYPPHEIGGYELRCRDIVERLQAKGHDVRILTSDHKIEGRDASGQSHVVRTLKINGMYGHPWRPIHQLRPLEIHNHEALAHEIGTFKPDLVHVWNMGGVSKSLLLRLEDGSTPLVYDISDHWIARSVRADVWLGWWNDPDNAAGKLAVKLLTLTGIRSLLGGRTPTRSYDTLAFRNIYFCSAFMRDHTASKKWPVSHAAVIHCGIDSAAFEVKADYSTFSKLLWVGRMNADKDPLTAIRALEAAREQGITDLTLDLYGGGTPEDFATVDAEIARFGLQDRVKRCFSPAAEMRSLYSRYDALLFTSNWGEPFALTPLEAGASGLPVISSLDGGQAELVEDGVNSIEAKAGDPASYALGIARLAADPALRERIAATALADARARFDIGIIATQIESFLLKVAAGGKP